MDQSLLTKKVDLVLDLCLMFLKPCMLNCGGGLGHKTTYGPTLYGINIIRSRFLLLYNEKGVLKFKSTC